MHQQSNFAILIRWLFCLCHLTSSAPVKAILTVTVKRHRSFMYFHEQFEKNISSETLLTLRVNVSRKCPVCQAMSVPHMTFLHWSEEVSLHPARIKRPRLLKETVYLTVY